MLRARADVAKADEQRAESIKARGGPDIAGASHASRAPADMRAVAFLRGKKKKDAAASAGAGGGASLTEAVRSVRWWDVYPPRSITVVTRSGTRGLAGRPTCT